MTVRSLENKNTLQKIMFFLLLLGVLQVPECSMSNGTLNSWEVLNLAVGCFSRYIRLQEEGYKYNLIHFMCIHNDKMMCIYRAAAKTQVWFQ